MGKCVVALVLVVIVAADLTPGPAAAAVVRVRTPEGSAHGFLVLRSTTAQILAQGDWWQIPSGERLEVHLRFRFTDGSLSHETFVLSQRRVWRVLSYRSLQQGPSFPRDIEAQVDRETGRYTVQSRDRQKGAKVDEGTIELPEDVYGFGMLAIVLKNLAPGEGLSAHALAFTPKPRILRLAVTPDGEESVTIEGLGRKTQRYQAKAELGGALGAVASVTNKQPPALHIWMAGEPTPTFVRFDGPFYADGPIWRVELAAPRWADDVRR